MYLTIIERLSVSLFAFNDRLSIFPVTSRNNVSTVRRMLLHPDCDKCRLQDIADQAEDLARTLSKMVQRLDGIANEIVHTL